MWEEFYFEGFNLEPDVFVCFLYEQKEKVYLLAFTGEKDYQEYQTSGFNFGYQYIETRYGAGMRIKIFTDDKHQPKIFRTIDLADSTHRKFLEQITHDSKIDIVVINHMRESQETYSYCLSTNELDILAHCLREGLKYNASLAEINC